MTSRFGPSRKIFGAAASLLDPRTYVHILRLCHYYSYSHVRERGRITMLGPVGFPPNISIANGERISIGARTKIGARSSLWAGDREARIIIGEDCRFGPEVFLTAADYGIQAGSLFTDQPRREADIVIGDGVWLSARVFVTAGVTIGDGCVVGAGAVVTRSLPANSVAVGVPARVVANREAKEEPLST
jgi:acetyltransferase-like isoleucine patch superfamily enzyme